MFPWLPGFHWTVGKAIFLGLFYAAATLVLASLALAVLRSRRDLRTEPPESLRWRLDFDDLPRTARACRHELTGEVKSRTCRRGLACETCVEHTEFQARSAALRDGACSNASSVSNASAVPSHSSAPARSSGPSRSGRSEAAGREQKSFDLEMPADRLYHRGHTWARPEPDGTMLVGIDDLGRRMVGHIDAIELPALGTKLYRNGPAWHAVRGGRAVRLLSPVDGFVKALGGPGDDWVLRVAPPEGGFETRHLLRGAEVTAWTLREIERLQLALSPPTSPALADGGTVAEDLPTAVPDADWDAVWGAMLLEV